MKKKVLATVLSAAMVASMLTACGDADTTTTGTDAAATTTTTSTSTTAATTDAAAAANEGSVLNIRVWNTEFKERVEEFYPGYEVVDGETGKIGDVTVKWTTVASDNNGYQDALDAALLEQENAAADDKVDMFLVEADYALKYVDTPYTMSVADLGITDAELANQYQYTKDVMTDSNGVLKGVSWQGCPGILFYNRDIAAAVLGTEDPDEVQEYVKDWATFNQTADLLKAAGYTMTCSANDSFRVYSNNVSSKWVVDGKINIDDNLMNWVNDSKALVDAGETGTYDLWSTEWNDGMKSDSGIFCYFGPAWLVNFCMHSGDEGYVANAGRWGGCVGPQSFFWGGTWICGATGTDNPSLVADIMRQLTTNADTMTQIVVNKDDFVNNKPAMEAMAQPDSGYASTILGGQNPLAMYCAGAEKIDLSNMSGYDQGCNESFQNAMKNYFIGEATLDEALELFYTDVLEKYPALSR